MEEEIKLLPCPFCGSSALPYSQNYHGMPYWSVSCAREDCFGNGSDNDACYQTEKDAIQAWNTRSPQDLEPLDKEASQDHDHAICGDCGSLSPIWNTRKPQTLVPLDEDKVCSILDTANAHIKTTNRTIAKAICSKFGQPQGQSVKWPDKKNTISSKSEYYNIHANGWNDAIDVCIQAYTSSKTQERVVDEEKLKTIISNNLVVKQVKEKQSRKVRSTNEIFSSKRR